MSKFSEALAAKKKRLNRDQPKPATKTKKAAKKKTQASEPTVLAASKTTPKPEPVEGEVMQGTIFFSSPATMKTQDEELAKWVKDTVKKSLKKGEVHRVLGFDINTWVRFLQYHKIFDE